MQELRLPRQVESDLACAAIRDTLAARRRKLWRYGVVEVAVLELSAAIEEALRTALARGQLRRGLEAVVDALEAERRGLVAIERREGRRGPDRISRLCAVTNDGAERFYRQVDRCLTTHAPRVLGCLLDVDSLTLGRLLYGRETPVKLVLADHKDAVATILRSVARR